jgi:hypothetical protein
MVLCTGASAAGGHFSQTALPVTCTDLYLPRFAVIPLGRHLYECTN